MSHYHQYGASKETQTIPFFLIRVLRDYVKLLQEHVKLISAHFYDSNRLKDNKVNDTAGIKAVNNPVTMPPFNYALQLLGWAVSLWPSGSQVGLVTR